MYAGINGIAGDDPKTMSDTLEPLFDCVVKHISPPRVAANSPVQMLVTNLDYDEHKGRIAIGRVNAGSISRGETIVIARPGAHPCVQPLTTVRPCVGI